MLLAGVSLLALAIVGAALMLRLGRSGGGDEVDSPPQPVAAAKSRPVAAAKSPQASTKDASTESPKEPPRNAPAKATVSLLIVPWGEVYVDGQKRGVSPPLKSLSLAPGMHTVEIRNSQFPIHVEKIDAKPGAQIKIRHTF
jgi:hypothetical protein